MIGRRMVVDDESSGVAKTSIKMTRSMAEDIGFKVKKIFNDIIEGTVDLSYAEWIWFISQCWGDEIWINAMIIVINKAREKKLNLNKNSFFLDFVLEKTPSELKAEFRKIHPIARLSLMELVDKKLPEPEKPRKFEELWG